MAISTFNVVLKWGASADAVEKVVDIKDFGDLLGEPNQLETTTLSDSQQTFIPGIRQSESVPFTCNYVASEFAKVRADEGKVLFYELTFSDGSGFKWSGQHSVSVPGKGVDEVIEYAINCSVATAMEYVAASA